MMDGSTLLSEFTVLKMNNLVWKKNDVVCDKLAKSTDCSKHYRAHGFACSPLLNLKLKNDVKNLPKKKNPEPNPKSSKCVAEISPHSLSLNQIKAWSGRQRLCIKAIKFSLLIGSFPLLSSL